ncbi:MAG: hypothetical protein ACOC91_02905 [bacterium]
MRQPVLLASLAALAAGLVFAAAGRTEAPGRLEFWPARALAVTLDAQAVRRFPGWLKSYAAARDFEISAHRYGPRTLVFTLYGKDIVIGGENRFDAQRYAVKFYRYRGRADPDAETIQTRAEAFSRHFRKKTGVTVSRSFAVREPVHGQGAVRKLNIALKRGARSRFLNRLRAYARKYGYVTTASENAGPPFPVMHLSMLGETVRISVSNPFDPREFRVFLYPNGPESSADGEMGRIAGQFADFIGQAEGVTVSERVSK